VGEGRERLVDHVDRVVEGVTLEDDGPVGGGWTEFDEDEDDL